MGAQRALLSSAGLLVPRDHAVGTRLCQSGVARLVHIDHHDPVRALADRAAGPGDARRVRTVSAQSGTIGDIDKGELPAFAAGDIDPTLAVKSLSAGVPRPLVAHVFVLAGQHAIVAALAAGHIDDQMRFLPHYRSVWTRRR
jgi:hypothetical protein